MRRQRQERYQPTRQPMGATIAARRQENDEGRRRCEVAIAKWQGQHNGHWADMAARLAGLVWDAVGGETQICGVTDDQDNRHTEESLREEDCYWVYAGSQKSFATFPSTPEQASEWITMERGQEIQSTGRAVLIATSLSKSEAIFQDMQGRWAPANDDRGHTVSQPSLRAKRLLEEADVEAAPGTTVRGPHADQSERCQGFLVRKHSNSVKISRKPSARCGGRKTT